MAGLKKVVVRYAYDNGDIAILEQIFSGIFRHEFLKDDKLEKERLDSISRFAAQFPNNIFQDEFAILYELVVTRRVTTGGWDTIEPIIEENRGLILSASQVSMSAGVGNPDSDVFDAFKSITKAVYDRVCGMPFAGAEGFRSSCMSFIEVFEKKYTRQCLNVMGAILNSPDTYVDYRGGRRREYYGYQGATEFFAVEKMKIDSLRGALRARQFVLDRAWFDDQNDPVKKAELVRRTERLCTLGIPEIDNKWSGIRRTHVVEFIGPPKGGKTTITAFCVYRLLLAKKRVAIWAMEGSAQESWIDKLIAAFCKDNELDIKIEDLQDGMAGVNKEQMNIINKVRSELVQNENLSFIEETGYVEDFLDVIDSHYRAFNKFDAIIIDSPLNLQTRTGRKKSEYLSSAFILLKDFIEHKYELPPVCIITAQFKQEAIKEARNSAEIVFDETSGGETAETIRTPDDVVAIFGTPAQIEVNRTTLYHVATRHTKLFPKIEVKANFECARFSSVNN